MSCEGGKEREIEREGEEGEKSFAIEERDSLSFEKEGRGDDC